METQELSSLRPEDETLTLRLMFASISEGDSAELARCFERLPFARMAQELFDRLLVTLINFAAGNGNDNIFRYIIERFAQENFDETRPGGMPIVTHLFTMRAVATETLLRVRKVFPEVGYSNHILALIKNDSSPENLDACVRLDAVYEEQSYNTYNKLLNVTYNQEEDEGYPNVRLQDYLREKVKETSPYRPKPKYIRDFTAPEGETQEYEEDDLPYDEELIVPERAPPQFEIPSSEEAVTLLLGGLDDEGLGEEEKDELREIMRIRYAEASTREKIAMLGPILKSKTVENLQDDVVLFRIFGPANPRVGNDLTDDGQCSRYGGCRMFLCIEYENYDEDLGVLDEEIDEYDSIGYVDWYNGACDYCHYGIEKRIYALRKPMIHGGWKGCYCSKECILGDIRIPDTLTETMIHDVEDQLNRIGIQDRLYRVQEALEQEEPEPEYDEPDEEPGEGEE